MRASPRSSTLLSHQLLCAAKMVIHLCGFCINIYPHNQYTSIELCITIWTFMIFTAMQFYDIGADMKI